jgi:alpha-glucosidase
LGPAHRGMAVSEEEGDKASPLAFARRFLKARKQSPALRLGEMEFVHDKAPLLAFLRRDGNERVLCVFNLSRKAASFRHASLGAAKALDLGCGEVSLTGGGLKLGPLACWFARI